MQTDLNSNELDVSIIMPCLNEAATIGNCIELAKATLGQLADDYGLSGEVIVADNGSTDGSQTLAESQGARVVAVIEKGYGSALRRGFATARGRYLVMGDSDMSYDFRESVPMILELQQGAELCMGNRFKGEIKPGAMPWKNRYIGNPVLSAILRVLFRTPIGDSHCGLRAIRRDAYERLSLDATGMEFASEMVLKATMKGLKMTEVPVTLSPDGRGRPPHLSPFRDGFRHLFYMLMLSPSWLFLGPSAVLFFFGLIVLTLLLVRPDGEMVQLGAFGLGDHWAIVAASSIVISTQTFVAGLATLIVGARERYMTPSPTISGLIRKSTLRGWLISGLTTIFLGFAWAGSIAAGWVETGFGALSEMRTLIAAFTLIVVGVQLVAGGFLLSIVSGNKLAHGAVLPADLSES